MAVGFACGGCSFQLHSLATHKDSDSSDQTGSIAQKGGASQTQSRPANPPSEFDLAYARAAAADVLARGSKDTSVPWENPQTGARGNITPLASAYNTGGATCRDFLASYVLGDSEAWLQGEACRMQGKWEVKSLKPWKQT
jgi:surface antigen